MANTSATVSLILKAKDETAEAFEGLKGRLESVKGLLEKALVWRAGERLFDVGIEGIKEFTSGLIGANADVETLHTSLTALYGSATEATQAIDYMTSFSLKAPFAKADILAAGQSIASFGQDITQVLPAIGNVAAAMGVDIPTATKALETALQTGRFQSLTNTLHITKAELEQFGLAVSSTGKVDVSTVLGAFERLSAAKFGAGMSSQLDTFAGATTNLHNQFEILQEDVGKPIFQALESELAKLVAFIQAHQEDLTRFADLFSTGFTMAGTAIGAAIGVIDGVVTTFVNWFSTAAMPIIETALGNVAIWWDDHVNKVSSSMTNIMDDVSVYTTYVEEQAGNMMTFLSGAFEAGWGIVSIVFTTATDLMSGNWDNFVTDFNSGVEKVQLGSIDMTAGVLSAVATLATNLVGVGATLMLPVANALLEPWTEAARGIRNLVVGIGAVLADMVAGIIDGMNAATNTIADALNAIIIKYNDVAGIIPGFGGKIKIPEVEKVNPIANVEPAKNAILAYFQGIAPGINQSQSIVAGASQSQAAAALAAQNKAILDPVVASLEASRAALIAQYGLSGGGGPTTPAQAVGKSELDKLNTLLDQLLHPMGGGGPTLGTVPALPNLNLAAATTALPTTTAGGSAAAAHLPTGRVPLGALGATFMTDIATTAKLHAGTDPATRAAQQQAAGQQKQISQGDAQTKLMQQQSKALAEVATILGDVRTYLSHLTGPHALLGNPLQSRGVGRPVR